MIHKIIRFFKSDIWRIRLKTLPRSKSFLIKQLRIVLLALRGFDEDGCQFKASALTYYTLLSIVPVLAVAFGIAKGFGMDKALENQLMNAFEGHEEVMVRVVDFTKLLLENTRGGLIAGIGVVMLFWLVIKVLGNVEESLNEIWGVKKPRSVWRKLSDYLSIMFICPLLLIISSSATVFIATQVRAVTEQTALLRSIGPVIFLLLKLLPYCVIWAVFTFVYIFMPNTKVNFKSAVLAGIVTGTAFQVAQWFYIIFQVGVARYNAIYGSFAALPLFLIWLQVSWLIVLFGAEISFACQNVDTYEFEPDCLRASYSCRKLLALRIVQLLVENFCNGERPWTATQISHALEIPIRLVRQLVYELSEGGIISETGEGEDQEVAYQPAQSTDRLTVNRVIEALDRRGSDDIPVAESRELDKLSECLAAFSEAVRKSPANIRLKDI